MDSDNNGSCAFDMLFTKNVPHILEKIFLSLDYKSFKKCLKVNNTWYELLRSESFKKKARSVFRKNILKDEKKLGQESKKGNIARIKKLFSSGLLNVNSYSKTTPTSHSKTTPLSKAAKMGHKEVVQFLLDQGAEINKGDKSGNTPLCHAADYKCKDVVQLLLNRGADPNKADLMGQTPLCLAAQSTHKEVVKLLLNAGADPNKTDCYGRTPLHCAVNAPGHARNIDKIGVVKLLLSKGADSRKEDSHGSSPWEESPATFRYL